jgi:hypothetical protein
MKRAIYLLAWFIAFNTRCVLASMVALPMVGVAIAAPAMADGPTYDLKCTNMINYAGDPRSNAEINGIGWSTGTCPTPIRGVRG